MLSLPIFAAKMTVSVHIALQTPFQGLSSADLHGVFMCPVAYHWKTTDLHHWLLAYEIVCRRFGVTDVRIQVPHR